MNWNNYPVHGWEDLLRTPKQFSRKIPKSFNTFLETRNERCLNVRTLLAQNSIPSSGGFPDWQLVGGWFVEQALADEQELVDASTNSKLELRWRSLCVDLATLLGEQIIANSSAAKWSYYVGSQSLWPSNEVVLRSRQDSKFIGMHLLSAFYATRMRARRLNDAYGPLGELRTYEIRQQDLASEKIFFQEIFEMAKKRFIESHSHQISSGDSSSHHLMEASNVDESYRANTEESAIELRTGFGGEGEATWEWIRLGEDEYRGVSFYTDESMDYWQVWVNAAEAVRDPGSYSALQDVVAAALSRISGVERAIPEDRETWQVFGNISGKEAVSELGIAIDEHLRHWIVGRG